ncbi:gamma-glutamylcyclotransferase-like [Teleopsis dalmanni]|uniref:gamma-glutamylcyclotransferase-like n=1 Tax=Teleopsis dalmanni TaxID=139649 RepID=UPI0018CF3EDE|nr:gamma-glutamylcyclotransferase-like [Teleopsis dalmanni]
MKLLYFLLALNILSAVRSASISTENVNDSSTFLYFGYGSNLLTKRIHIRNPTAVKIGAGRLENYRLDFNSYADNWDGAPATIVPTENSTVYGTLWEIDISNLADIDDQEGVSEGEYEPVNISVFLNNDTVVNARSYVLVKQPEIPLKMLNMSNIPFERQPSKTYLQCLVKGAIESELPDEYIRWLRTIKHNGKVAKALEDLLKLSDIELST